MNILKSNFIVINFLILFLLSCSGGGGSGSSTSSTSSVSSNYGNSSCSYSCSDTTNSNGSSFASGTSDSYNSSLASTWAGRQEFDNVLYNGSVTGVQSTQNIYEVMNVHKAYGYGYSGDGVTIHVQDSGFDKDHHEFNGKTVTLYQTNYTADTTSSYHANSVASIALGDYNGISTGNINSSTGSMMGVAYNADLYFSDYDTNKSGSDFAADWSDALDASPSTTAASNHSYGITADIHTVLAYQTNNSLSDAATIEAYMDAAGFSSTSGEVANWIASLKTFQANKGVIVWALGNHSDQNWNTDKAHVFAALPEMDADLKGAWLTVSTVDIAGSSGSETYHNRYSNCGVTAEYCLSTDSYGVVVAAYENQNSGSVDSDNSSSYYSSATGNSFGAPMVSGSVAILSEAFSSLTPKEIAARLLATADNTWFDSDGTTTFSNGVKHGFNFRFGHGIPDLDKALKPITSNMLGNSVLVGGNINNSQSYSLNSSALNMDAAFGDAFAKGLKNETGVFFDALYGDFNYDFSKSTNQISNNSQKDPFEKPITYNTIQLENKNGIKSNFISVTDENNNGNFISPNKGFAYTTEFNNADFVISKKMPLEAVLGFYSLDDDVLTNKNREAFRIPFIQDADDGFSYASNIIKDGNNSISIGYYNTNDNDAYDKQALISSFNFGSKDSKKSIVLGYAEEEERFLNSSTSGAFNLNGKNTPTNFISNKFNKKFSNGSEVLFTASYGSTNVNTSNDTLINKIDNLSSSSFAINFLNEGLVNKKDSFSITLHQPHRIETGSANISIPSGRDKSGNLYYRNKDIPLSPSGRQLDLSMAYNYDFSQRSTISANASITNNYNHIKDNEIHNSLSLMYNLSF